MEYVKITAPTEQEALFEARRQYGSNIIPMNYKNIRTGGFFGTKLLANTAVELTAGIPERTREKKSNGSSMSDSQGANAGGQLSANIDQGGQRKGETIRWHTQEESGNAHSATPPKGQGWKGSDQEAASLQRDQESLTALKDLLSKSSQGDPGQASAAGQAAPASPPLESGANSYSDLVKGMEEIKAMLASLEKRGGDANLGHVQGSYHDTPLDYWESHLLDADFSVHYVDRLIYEVRERLSVQELSDRQVVKKKLLSLLRGKIGIAPPIMREHDHRKVAAFIGPTGVGKTTTMAKLGAIYTFYKNKKVAFFTIDNYRIAATEQLKRYAAIIDVPTYVISDGQELAQAVAQEDAELILIDTSGRSPYHKEHLEEMKSIFAAVDEPVERILVTSATGKRRDHEAVFDNFAYVGIDKVVFSKLDESTAIGGILETADTYNKGVSYITFGQDVPSDIEEANAQKLALLALGDRERPLGAAQRMEPEPG